MLWQTDLFACKLNAMVVLSPSQISFQQPILLLFSQFIQELAIKVDMKLLQQGNTKQGFSLPVLGISSSTVWGFNMLTVLGYIHHHLLDKDVICKASFCQSAFSWLIKWNLMKALGVNEHIASRVSFLFIRELTACSPVCWFCLSRTSPFGDQWKVPGDENFDLF